MGLGQVVSYPNIYAAIKLLWTLEWTLLANHVINLWAYSLCEICTHWLFWVKIMKLITFKPSASGSKTVVAAGIIWSGFSQCLCSRLLSQKLWFTKCFGHRFSLNISALSCSGCTGSIEGSWKRSSRLRAEVWETENEIETEWIRRGVREIRTLPQEAGLNSSSPCMVKNSSKSHRIVLGVQSKSC